MTRLKYLEKANDEAIELCHAVLEHLIPRLKNSPPHTNCEAEDVAGKAQQYLKEP